ncbi:UNKNOWN [Stylonychia lemnae]|uniref:Uncharacterized protein n=1 Tax=Stylonychia lemnae TaxID=5949 RepID=A0A077ZUP5_STYLE|nr:UNKNOWN [Stylonychia lemnae]|eukprot:CDW73025.1 UNKNOWN [Stylonychia lemnae]
MQSSQFSEEIQEEYIIQLNQYKIRLSSSLDMLSITLNSQTPDQLESLAEQYQSIAQLSQNVCNLFSSMQLIERLLDFNNQYKDFKNISEKYEQLRIEYEECKLQNDVIETHFQESFVSEEELDNMSQNFSNYQRMNRQSFLLDRTTIQQNNINNPRMSMHIQSRTREFFFKNGEERSSQSSSVNQTQHQELILRNQKLDEEIKSYNQQLKLNSKELEIIKKHNQRYQDIAEKYQSENKQLEDQIIRLKKEVENLNKTAKDHKLLIDNLQNSNESLNTQKFKYLNTIQKSFSEIKELKSNLAFLNDEKIRLSLEKKSLKIYIEELTKNFEDINQAILQIGSNQMCSNFEFEHQSSNESSQKENNPNLTNIDKQGYLSANNTPQIKNIRDKICQTISKYRLLEGTKSALKIPQNHQDKDLIQQNFEQCDIALRRSHSELFSDEKNDFNHQSYQNEISQLKQIKKARRESFLQVVKDKKVSIKNQLVNQQKILYKQQRNMVKNNFKSQASVKKGQFQVIDQQLPAALNRRESIHKKFDFDLKVELLSQQSNKKGTVQISNEPEQSNQILLSNLSQPLFSDNQPQQKRHSMLHKRTQNNIYDVLKIQYEDELSSMQDLSEIQRTPPLNELNQDDFNYKFEDVNISARQSIRKSIYSQDSQGLSSYQANHMQSQKDFNEAFDVNYISSKQYCYPKTVNEIAIQTQTYSSSIGTQTMKTEQKRSRKNTFQMEEDFTDQSMRMDLITSIDDILFSTSQNQNQHSYHNLGNLNNRNITILSQDTSILSNNYQTQNRGSSQQVIMADQQLNGSNQNNIPSIIQQQSRMKKRFRNHSMLNKDSNFEIERDNIPLQKVCRPDCKIF